MNPQIALCTLHLHIPEAQSLKDKRAIVKSLTKRLQNQYNLSVAEIDAHDKWQVAIIAIVTVSNKRKYSERVIQQALEYIETNYPQALITQEHIELI